MDWFGWESIGVAWDLLRDAALLGWAATALFCAVAGAAVALWAGVRWWWGVLLGAVALYAGLALLLLIGAVRAGDRVRRARARTTTGVAVPAPAPTSIGYPSAHGYPPPSGPPVALPAPGGPAVGPAAVGPAAVGPAAPGPAAPERVAASTPGFRAGVRRGWQWWTRTPPRRAEWGVAVVAVLLAVALIVATQVTWLTLRATGRTVTGVGPFEIQLGLFVVLSALAAVVCAAGVLRWCSAWWPVLLAWFATWWAFIALEVLRVQGALDALNRLLGDQVLERTGFDARPEIELGVGWTVMLGLAVVMMVLAVALLVLQGRGASHYRASAPS